MQSRHVGRWRGSRSADPALYYLTSRFRHYLVAIVGAAIRDRLDYQGACAAKNRRQVGRFRLPAPGRTFCLPPRGPVATLGRQRRPDPGRVVLRLSR